MVDYSHTCGLQSYLWTTVIPVEYSHTFGGLQSHLWNTVIPVDYSHTFGLQSNL
jgi:hypothetical protein